MWSSIVFIRGLSNVYDAHQAYEIDKIQTKMRVPLNMKISKFQTRNFIGIKRVAKGTLITVKSSASRKCCSGKYKSKIYELTLMYSYGNFALSWLSAREHETALNVFKIRHFSVTQFSVNKREKKALRVLQAINRWGRTVNEQLHSTSSSYHPRLSVDF